jgi:nucleoside-diphosphate-sugar epimerase
MEGIDVVINCVSGDGVSISDGARCLVEASKRSGVKKIIHMSSMAVYGLDDAQLDEKNTPFAASGNWYADAKIKAESEMASFAPHGDVIIFRIGCVAGPGSNQWVRRIGDLLTTRRIGDLGSNGDGWSNIVALNDVCQAVVLSVYRPAVPERVNIFNLAAPDSPRWNTYFVDFAQLIGASPPARISARQLKFEAFVKAPASLIYGKIRRRLSFLPPWGQATLSPSLMRLFRHAGKLETVRIESSFSISWTGYEDTLRQGAAWYIDERHRTSPA